METVQIAESIEKCALRRPQHLLDCGEFVGLHDGGHPNGALQDFQTLPSRALADTSRVDSSLPVNEDPAIPTSFSFVSDRD